MYGTKLYFMVVENFLAGGPVRSPRPPGRPSLAPRTPWAAA